MKIISICNHKGGSGKTTCSIHIAAALGLVGYKTLVVDIDPQGFLTKMVGLAEPREEKSSLGFFGMDARFNSVHKEHLQGFDVVPSSTKLTSAMRNLTKPTDVFWMREVLQENAYYDYIVIDSSSAITVYTLNALVASDYAIIPVVPEHLPIIGGEQTYKTCELVQKKLNPDLNLPYFLLTQVDGRKTGHLFYRKYLREHYKGRVLKNIIRTSASLANETLSGETVFQRDSKSKGAIDFANVTDEILRIIQKDEQESVTNHTYVSSV